MEPPDDRGALGFDSDNGNSKIDPDALQSLRETFGEGVESGSFRDILATFIEQAGKLERDLDGYIVSADEVGAGRVAHTLKSASLLVGARDLAAVCLRLETLRSVADPDYASLVVTLKAESRAACDELRRVIGRE